MNSPLVNEGSSADLSFTFTKTPGDIYFTLYDGSYSVVNNRDRQDVRADPRNSVSGVTAKIELDPADHLLDSGIAPGSREKRIAKVEFEWVDDSGDLRDGISVFEYDVLKLP